MPDDELPGSQCPPVRSRQWWHGGLTGRTDLVVPGEDVTRMLLGPESILMDSDCGCISAWDFAIIAEILHGASGITTPGTP